MSSFDTEIRARLERAAGGIEPTFASRTATLRRARRKRTLHAVVSGGVMALAIVAAVFVTDLAGNTLERSSQVASDGEALQVPDGELKIASGGEGEGAWLLYRSPEDGCFSLTTARHAEGEVCANQATLNVHHIPNGEGMFVYGDLSSRVVELELRATKGGRTELLPVPIISEADAVRDADDPRRYFVSDAGDAPFTVVVATRDDGRKISRMVGPRGLAVGVATAQGAAVCSTEVKARGVDPLAEEMKALVTEIKAAEEKMVRPKTRGSRGGRDRAEHFDLTMESCESTFTRP